MKFSDAIHFSDHYVYLGCLVFSKISISMWYSPWNIGICSANTCMLHSPLGNFRTLNLCATEPSFCFSRYCFAAFSTFSFSSMSESGLKPSLAKTCQRNGVILTTHSLSALKPVKLRCLHSSWQAFPVAAVPINGWGTISSPFKNLRMREPMSEIVFYSGRGIGSLPEATGAALRSETIFD